MDYSCKPMVKYPVDLARDSQRENDHFSTTYAQTLGHLERELGYLGANHVVFQLAVDESAIRMDGRLRSDARPMHPGIVVTFQSKFGPLSYFTDHYRDWRANLRAITITLQNLRKIDEHGVNKKGAQYEGYKRLNAAPAATNGRPKIETPQQAAEFIVGVAPGVTPNQLLTHSYLMESVYRQAARTLHPDNKETGDDAKFVELQDAAAVLRTHHGL